MDQDFDFKFSGIKRLYGETGYEKLQQAHVCVVGLGGVGSWTVEALARMGLNEITLVDFDDICRSNVNRQLHALEGNYGKLKTEALKSRCLQINKSIKVNIFDIPYNDETANEILENRPDVLVDCADTLANKIHMIVTGRRLKIPVVTVGSAGGLKDPTQIRCADLARSRNDRLLMFVKKRLRQRHGFPRNLKEKFKVNCVFSEELPEIPEIETCEGALKPEGPLDCATGYGTATHLTGSFGFFAAYLAVKEIMAK